ncbi:hypothetical protein P3S67_028685 [Capsicum chacoense]
MKNFAGLSLLCFALLLSISTPSLVYLYVLVILGQAPKLCPSSFPVVFDQCPNINCFLEALKVIPASKQPQHCRCSPQGKGSLCSCLVLCD